MKRALLGGGLILVLALNSQAAEPPQKYDRQLLIKTAGRYMECLKSDNYGVRKSALYQLAKLHALDPTIDMKAMCEQICKISKKDTNPLLRVQAELTIRYITDEELAKLVRPVDEDDGTAFYNQVHTVLASRW